jgi:hypothetical protein
MADTPSPSLSVLDTATIIRPAFFRWKRTPPHRWPITRASARRTVASNVALAGPPETPAARQKDTLHDRIRIGRTCDDGTWRCGSANSVQRSGLARRRDNCGANATQPAESVNRYQERDLRRKSTMVKRRNSVRKPPPSGRSAGRRRRLLNSVNPSAIGTGACALSYAALQQNSKIQMVARPRFEHTHPCPLPSQLLRFD